MKKGACPLATSVILLGLVLSSCGGGVTTAGSNNFQPPVSTQTTSPANGGGAVVPINVLTEQLIADPAKYIGQTVSFGSVVTDFGVGYVMFGKIKVVTDLVPAARIETSATITGVCQGLVEGLVVLTKSIIIPSCEVA